MDSTTPPYQRELLERSDTREILLMRWRPGASSAAHDHGRARGRVFVVSGTVEERVVVEGADGLVITTVRRASAPAILEVEPGVVHVMHAVDAALTLHVYEPPIERMRIWDPERREVLEVDDEHGAWQPEADRVLARMAWARDEAGHRESEGLLDKR
jgi:cysteine dioxygenase